MFEYIGVDPKIISVVLISDLAPKIRELFQRNNGLEEITAFLGVTKDPQSGESLGGLKILILRNHSDLGLDDSNQEKGMFTQILRSIAEKAGALFIAVTSEIWIVKTSDDPVESKAIQDWMCIHQDISECPYRQEAVMIQLEHSKTTPRYQLWTAPINESLEGVRKVGEFVLQEHDEFSGRFTHLLPDPVELVPTLARNRKN